MTTSKETPLVSVLRAGDIKVSGDNEWGAIATAYRSPDRSRAAGIWSFGAGSFDYKPNHEELLYVIEGTVEVAMDAGESFSLTCGDLAYFPANIRAHWNATVPVRAAFCSLADEIPLDY